MMNKEGMFYTVDPSYRQFNDMKYQIIDVLLQCKDDRNSIYEVELENGCLIRAFGDELNGFIRRHEKDPIRLPVVWTSKGFVEIPYEQAQTISEAKQFFFKSLDKISLPQGEYLEDSMELAVDDELDISLFNYSFRNQERCREGGTDGRKCNTTK